MIDLYNTHWYANEKMGWYPYSFPIKNHPTGYMELYNEIVEWILENLDNPHRHVRWHINNSDIRVKFRYEQDYLRFILRFS